MNNSPFEDVAERVLVNSGDACVFINQPPRDAVLLLPRYSSVNRPTITMATNICNPQPLTTGLVVNDQSASATQIVISKIKNVMDKFPVIVNTTWDKFVSAFRKTVVRGTLPHKQYLAAEKSVRDKQKDGVAIICGAHGTPNSRAQVDLIYLSILALDLDDGFYTFDKLCKVLDGYEAVVHTSYSHSLDKPKFRAYLLLKQPIHVEIKATLCRIIDFMENRLGDHIDQACRKPGQAFFTPSCPPGGEDLYQYRHIHGLPIDPADFPAPPEKDRVQQERTTGNRPGDDFNNRGSWSELLILLGWSEFYSSAGNTHYTRPGKQTGVSGSVLNSGIFYVHTSATEATPFKSGTGYSLFGAFSLIYHNGDCKAAAKDLASKGYGDPRKDAAGRNTQQKETTDPVLTTEDFVEQMNRTHFVSREGGKTFVYREEFDEQMSRNVLMRSSFIDFQNYYLNKLVVSGEDKYGKPTLKPLGTVWLKDPDRRQYSGIILSPGKDTPGCYNLWRGFSVEPVEGSWKEMNDHIFNIICSRNDVAYEYVLGWLATAVQHPDKQAEVALVLRGKRGTGKGMLGNCMCQLFGGNAAHITSSKYLTGNFNSHLRDVVFMFADEAFWAGDKQGESTLKGIITEPTLTIEGKGKDIIFVRNMLHILMASNNDWVVPAGLEERRFCVLDISDECMQNKHYFETLVNKMEHGGLEAMLYALLNYDLSRFQIRDVPQTTGLYEQKLQSLDDFSQWWFHCLCEGELVSGEEGWGSIPCHILYQSYICNLADRAINRRAGQTLFGRALRKVLPAGSLRKYYSRIQGEDSSKQVNHYQFPKLDICREHFEMLMKSEINWDV